jgi:membrane-bound lytic murein transglycosylase A
LLTAYYEPVLNARRQPGAGFQVPLYQAPPGLSSTNPWYTRQQIETQASAQAALRGREIAYLSDPVEAMVLHIQGSGQLQITEPDGRISQVRLAFAGTNGQAYQSIGRWLLDQGLTQDASWPGIRQWLARNPQRSQELMWKNPRYVFFKEQKLGSPSASELGPVGAQGLALTAGRSIAVDPRSIPYGSPLWLVSSGASGELQKMVFAQDTGSAIQGAVRADYFAGSGASAGEWAGRFKQPLSLWVLWPR